MLGETMISLKNSLLRRKYTTMELWLSLYIPWFLSIYTLLVFFLIFLAQKYNIQRKLDLFFNVWNDFGT